MNDNGIRKQIDKIDYEVNLMEPLLLCPVCLKEMPDGRGSWLHQTGVEAFFRDEGSDRGVHGYIADTNLLIEQDGNCGRNSRNPSARRDGLIIYFQCEWHFQDVLELHITQHQGQTMMNWLVDINAKVDYDEEIG